MAKYRNKVEFFSPSTSDSKTLKSIGVDLPFNEPNGIFKKTFIEKKFQINQIIFLQRRIKSDNPLV